jgi:hypothetical protein
MNIIAQFFYSIQALLKHLPNQNKDSILGNGFLSRKGSTLIVGPAGVGKSKFAHHLAYCMALGLDFLGIKVNAKTRVLLIQAEDVLDDLAESVQGFVKHTIKSDPKGVADLESNLHMATVEMVVGTEFTKVVDQLCEETKPDVLIIDPLVAYMGCDLVDQGAVTSFLRHDLASVVRKHNCALICVHHARRDKGGPMVDRAYGGMEFSAFFRGILDLSGDPKDYRSVRVKVTKRQRQLGLKDGLGQPTDSIEVKMGKDAVYWTVSDQYPGVVSSSAGGRNPKVAPEEVARVITDAKARGAAEKEIVSEVAEKLGYSRKQAGRLVKRPAMKKASG